MRDFDKWLGEFRKSIADYKYYINFPKVFENVDSIRIELNILNSLIGIAANLLGRRFLGIDMEESFLKISVARREEIDNSSLRAEYLKKLQRQAKILVGNSMRVAQEAPAHYGDDLPL